MRLYNHGRRMLLMKLGLDAEAFTQMVQQDDTADFVNQNTTSKDMNQNLDKAPAWGSQSSMEAGDAGTRNYQMGLPRAGAV